MVEITQPPSIRRSASPIAPLSPDRGEAPSDRRPGRDLPCTRLNIGNAPWGLLSHWLAPLELTGWAIKSSAMPTILLVEDEVLVRLVTCEALVDSGLIVHQADNASQAIDILESGSTVDFVLTDVRMPGEIDG